MAGTEHQPVPAVRRRAPRPLRKTKRARIDKQSIPDEYLEPFLALYRFGLSAEQVAKVFNANTWAVYSLFKRNGIKLRSRSRLHYEEAKIIRYANRRGLFYARASDPDADDVRHATTQGKLGRWFGISKPAINHIVTFRNYNRRADYVD